MTPEFHRAEATRCRRAATRSPSTAAARLRTFADENEQIADILEELQKINARVPRAPEPC
jgi:hypothetical protein